MSARSPAPPPATRPAARFPASDGSARRVHALRDGVLARSVVCGPLRWLCGFTLLVNLATRVGLMAMNVADLDTGFAGVCLIMLIGSGNDLIAFGYYALPLALLRLLPARMLQHGVGQTMQWTVLLLSVWLVLFVAMAEVVFWDEFAARFNFIAVDYLVYTHEVLTNIWESYPVGVIMLGLFAAGATTLFVQRNRLTLLAPAAPGWQRPLAQCAAWMVVAWPAVAYLLTDPAPVPLFANRYADELAASGAAGFFRGFKAAELDYARFYPQLPASEAVARAAALKAGGAPETGADNLVAARRGPHHVVLISVESLSASYLRHFGGSPTLTPALDRLADEGLLFTDLYATGTRTVRGLEALALSLPPGPGESIIKRPDNSGLDTLGSILGRAHYDVRFLYGGDARFDDMRRFFGVNGYTVLDRQALSAAEIHHENAWGVADEDVYTLALRVISRSARAGCLTFTHIMTTSNHRPYTYPDGRVTLPSGAAGRQGAVQYTDWAVGDFLARARHEPWFDDTIFVITADHCASSAGKTRLPLRRYHIPLIIYAPGLVPTGVRSRLASQIDVAPTILGLLGLPRATGFFGRDLLRPGLSSFAFVSTYRELGFLRDNRLVELAPRLPPQLEVLHGHSRDERAGTDRDLVRDAMALYQVSASTLHEAQRRPGAAR